MEELLKKKGVRIGLLVLIILVVIGIIAINAQSAQKRRNYNEHIDVAEKYLSDLDYEQAIAEYKLALEIEPKSEEVLSGLEQTYLAYAGLSADTGDYEKAIVILEEGYAVTERDSLREQIEEYREIQQMTGQEVQTETEAENEVKIEAMQASDIKQMVESSEFEQQILALVNCLYYPIITNEQVRKLCLPRIEALERYRELYPEENSWWYCELPYLYYLIGEHELCAQLIKEFRERFPDNGNISAHYKDEDSETIRDEYGRMIQSTAFFQTGGKQVSEYEYGQDGKMIRQSMMNDSSSDGIATSIWEYEYDSEGRLSKRTIRGEYSLGSSISVTTYEYSGKGFTTYENTEYSDSSGNYRMTTNYVINEYGEFEMVGEPIFEGN